MYQSIHQYITCSLILLFMSTTIYATQTIDDVCTPNPPQPKSNRSVVDSLTAGRYWEPKSALSGL